MQRTALLLSLSSLLFACSSSPSPSPPADSGPPDGSTVTPEAGASDSGGGDTDAGPDCGPLPNIPANNAACPPAYTHADGGCGSPCTTGTLGCLYPGAGDPTTPGCPSSTAQMLCEGSLLPDGGSLDPDGGGDFWVCSQ